MTTTANGSANGDARSREREEWLVANYLTARADLFRRFSGIIDQRRDIPRDCHWPNPPFPPELLQAVYEHDPLGYRVATIRPEASWQAKLSVYDSERSDTATDFEAGLVECGRDLEGEPSYLEDDELPWLRSLLRRADELAGVAQYGVVVLGTDDGLPPDQPAKGFEEVNSAPAGRNPDGSPYAANVTGPYKLTVNARAAKGTKLVSAQPFPEYLAPIASFENNPTSPRYCRPTSYSVTFADPNAAGTVQSQQGTVGVTRTVHWSRVVHVALGRRSSPTFCPPRLDPVLYPVLDARKIRGAGAEGYWQQAFALLFLMTDPALGGDVHVSDEARQGLKDMLENIRNGLQRDGLLKGFTPQTVAPAVADPTGQYGLQVDTICVGIDVPKRIFLGSERGELASSQDTRDWLASVRLRNTGELTPCLVGPVVSRLVSLGGVAAPPPGFKADWEDVSTQTDQEKAAVFLTRVQAYAAYVAGGVEALFTPLDAMTRLDAMTQDEAQAVIDAHAENADDALTLPPPGEPGHPATPGTPPRPAGQAPDDTPAVPAANTFCPTGEGGGVDPSCSPGGGPAGVSAAAGRLHAYLAGAGGEHTLTSLAGALRTKPGKLAPALDELLRGGHAEEAGVRGAETAYRARAAPDAVPHTPGAVGSAATLAADRVPYLAGTRVGANKAFISDVYDHLAPRLGGMTLGAFKSQLLAALAAGHVRLTRADLPQLMPRDKVARSETAHRVGGYHAADYHFVTGRAPAANYDPDQPRDDAGRWGEGGITREHGPSHEQTARVGRGTAGMHAAAAVEHLKEHWGETKQQLYDGLPEWGQKAVDAGLAVEHKLEGAYKSGRELALAVARERGLSEDHVDKVGHALGMVDAVLRNVQWAAVHPVADAVGGPVLGTAASKASYYTPTASLAYVGYSMAREALAGRNPLRMISAARERVRAQRAEALTTHAEVTVNVTDADREEFAAALTEWYASVPPDALPWAEALVAAALDEHRGDPAEALAAARSAFAADPQGPGAEARP